MRPFLALITPVGDGPVDLVGLAALLLAVSARGLGPPRMPRGSGRSRHPVTWRSVIRQVETGVPHPSHPIAQPPLGIWGGGNVPFPTPPIFIGPEVPPPDPAPPITWHSAWTPQTGWMTVGIPNVEHPTPSE